MNTNHPDFVPKLYAYVMSRFTYDPENGTLVSKHTKRPIGSPNKYGLLGTSIRIDGKQYVGYVHRMIWLYHNKTLEGDIVHLNKDKKDNRIVNLACVKNVA